MTIHRIEVPPALDARSTGSLAAAIERAAAEPRGVIVQMSKPSLNGDLWAAGPNHPPRSVGADA